MGDASNSNNAITQEQLEQFGSQLMTKMEQQLQQAMKQHTENKQLLLKEPPTKGKDKMTVSSDSISGKGKSPSVRSAGAKRRNRYRRPASDDDEDSDSSYHPLRSS